MADPLIIGIGGRYPQLHPEAWAAPNASLIGQVSLAARASVWYSATLRAEAEPIEIGVDSNIQDGVTIHVDKEFPVRVGARVSVGHNAVLHGCTIGDDSLIGMGAIVLNGATVGSRVSGRGRRGHPAGHGGAAPVTGVGVPGRVRRELSEAEIRNNRHNASVYRLLIEVHRAN